MGEAITIKARFSRGFIEPLEKLEFEESMKRYAKFSGKSEGN